MGKEMIPVCPPKVWETIYSIARRGNDAIVKIRNGEVQVIEAARKLQAKETLK